MFKRPANHERFDERAVNHHAEINTTVTEQECSGMLAGYLKCPSKFLIQARIQADFNTFYLDLSLHGSIGRKQGKGSL